MTEDLKKRLIGAAVLVSLAVIFIPVLIEEQSPVPSIRSTNIPSPPPIQHQDRFLPAEEVAQERAAIAFGNSSITPEKDAEVREITQDEQQAVADETGKPAVVKPRVGLTGWMVQAGSFSSQENAEKLVAKLRDAGFDTHLESAQVKSLNVYRVRVGPEIDKTNADKIAEKISKAFFVNPKVIQYP